MYAIRKAQSSDAHTIRALVFRSGINPSGLDWRRFLVAELPGGEIIAVGQIKPHRDGSQELASIAVTPTWRRRGVARAIIQALIAGHNEELYLMCRSRLRPFYEKFGFHQVQPEEMPRYFRKVSQLAGLAGWLLNERESLVVMKKGD
jgi:amino-acid N-acetyltransferase